MLHYAVVVHHCDVTMLQCEVTVLHCCVSMLHYGVSVFTVVSLCYNGLTVCSTLLSQ